MSIPGILPSKRVSKVKPVNEYSSIPELQALRSRTLLHLGPTCPSEVRHQVQNRIAQIDSRIQQLSQANISTIAQGVQHLSLDALPSYNQPGPSNSKPVNYRWTSDASSSNGGGGVSPVSPMSSNDPNTPFGASVPLSSSPTTHFFTTTKARIVAQPLVNPQSKHRSSKIQAMDLDETIQREQVEFEKAAAQREKVEARKAKLEALRPPSTQAARAGLSEAEMRAKILAFMNFKGDSDDEDDDEEEWDDDEEEARYIMQEGQYADCDDDSGDEQMADEEAYVSMLSNIIQVDTSRPGGRP
ncbi:hypothetical protein FRC04_000108 [Tulasnella sp. 424]|nr:hypothetical protein FRC04_000108 [Tulasnella sp. 424]KAG8981971.1 hypothetical protein FRC05_000113 [Tulasnella sp. 425]